MGRRRNATIAFEPPPPRDRTVLLDQFGVGTTWGYDRTEDNRLCSGEVVDHVRDEQTSESLRWRNRWGI
jgi:hypothetical protein